MAVGVAGDAGPGAVTGRGVPGGKRRLGVVGNGCFQGKKGTILRHRGRGGMMKKEEEDKQEKKPHL